MTTFNRKTVTTTRPVFSQNYNNNSKKSTTVEVNSKTTYTRQPDISDYITTGLVIFIVIVGIIGFIKSVRSRKFYKCPSCGESFRSENMESMTCKVCGANLEETNDSNITDKTK